MYFDNSSAATQSQMSYLDVKNLAQTGEGKYLEFKRTVPTAEKIAREIASFANTNGGTILIGVDDDSTLIGVEGYHEEEYLLNKAASESCSPKVDISIEVVQFGEKDLLVVRVPESDKKPIYVNEKKGEVVYTREKDENKTASKELVKIMHNKNSDKGITFEYGPHEQKLFRYLNEYGEITVVKFSHLIDVDKEKASGILVNLVSTEILNLFTKDDTDYFTYSNNFKSE